MHTSSDHLYRNKQKNKPQNKNTLQSTEQIWICATSIYFSLCFTYLFSYKFFLPLLIIQHTAFLHLDPQSKSSGWHQRGSLESVLRWFPGKAGEVPLVREGCVCSVEISDVVVAKEVSQPPEAFSLHANHVFTLPQRSELILTSH